MNISYNVHQKSSIVKNQFVGHHAAIWLSLYFEFIWKYPLLLISDNMRSRSCEGQIISTYSRVSL